MRELALVALFAEAALVVFADEVADAAAFGGGEPVAIRTSQTSRAVVVGFVLWTYWAGGL